jgi:abortive infection bacteriophage resistance protein
VIEIRVRSVVAYYHAHKYGNLGYMDSQNFENEQYHEQFKQQLSENIDRRRTASFVHHHLVKYSGDFPAWVAVELFSMGMLSQFYARLPLDDRKAIAKLFATDYVHLTSWLHALTILRNNCAHYERLYAVSFDKNPRLPKKIAVVGDRNQRTLFYQILMLKLLYHGLSDKWNTDILAPLSELVKQFREYIDFAHIGFPENWEEIMRRS